MFISFHADLPAGSQQTKGIALHSRTGMNIMTPLSSSKQFNTIRLNYLKSRYLTDQNSFTGPYCLIN